jgi:hypothetical protein
LHDFLFVLIFGGAFPCGPGFPLQSFLKEIASAIASTNPLKKDFRFNP